ncbi:ABC transporter ATP-binding protein [Streptomyces solisilvae]|uniref:ABC transporter ATP-binding protein n=1 Tax=Streptomyces malaysiensis TaxID=92644 RepID=UPI0036BCD590
MFLTTALTVLALVSPAQAVATAWLVTRVETAHRLGVVAAPICVLIGVLLLRQLSESMSEQIRLMSTTRIDGTVRARVRGVALVQDGVGPLESAEFRDDAALASGLGVAWQTQSPGAAATGQYLLVFRFIGAVVSTAVLAHYFLLLALGLLAASLAMRAIIRRQWMYLAAVRDGLVGEQRRSEYWSDLAAGSSAAKEVRLFGLPEWVMDRRRDGYLKPTETMWSARRLVLRRQGTTTAIAAGSALCALGVPGVAVTHGQLTIGALAGCLVAAWGIFQIGYMGHEAFDIETGAGAVRALDRLIAVGWERRLPGTGTVPQGAKPPLVRFEGVEFAYPGSVQPVLRGLDLEIRPGEVLAVVGANGAGKTTLINLLGALYQPTSGRITVDGHDLADIVPGAWRRLLSVVFQDFVRYPTTVRDNVALSAPEYVDDEGVMTAMDRAGAGHLAGSLAQGIHTRLWRGGANGADLSGGEWQRLVIARALFAVDHGRRILVLDEPTANLDVLAEAEFYKRVIATVSGASVVLISHRLSTIRQADRIVVLDGGSISESGTHTELIEQRGEYARLFRLQATRFADTMHDSDGASEEVPT